MRAGIFITVEGTDGVGKGTQLEYIKKYLQDANIDFITIREPGGTDIGESIRKILLDPQFKNMSAETELLLFNASRAQLIREKILPTLKAGVWVISDRFFDSTVAYQVGGRGLPEDACLEIIKFACDDLEPNLTIYFDLDEYEAIKRIDNRIDKSVKDKDRLENVDSSFNTRVRDKYLELAASKKRIKTISAAGTVEEVNNRVKILLDEIIEKYKKEV